MIESLTETIPPNDYGAELALLGSMIIDPKVIDDVLMLVPDPGYFYETRNAFVFPIIVDMNRRGGVDALQILSELNRIARDEIANGDWHGHMETILGTVPSAAHAEHYASIVREKYLFRRLTSTGHEIQRMALSSTMTADETISEAEKKIMRLSGSKVKGNACQTINEALQASLEAMDNGTMGLPFGLAEIDALTTGMHNGELILIAARPSVGKSAAMMGIIEHNAVDRKTPSGVFSMEMRKEELAQRMLCGRAGVDSQRLRRNQLSIEERGVLSACVGEISSAPLWVDDSAGLTIAELRSRARRMKADKGIKLLAVDYLQLMEGRGSNRQEQVSEISRGMKAIARELEIPVIALCQLNRASETENRMPRSSDLRESGSLEQDADVVILLHREAVAHRGETEWFDANPDRVNLATAIIAKQRNGPCDSVRLTFLSAQTRFVNYCPGGV